ncbi:MAG TPA: hypothetical protein VGX76_15660 [Pirellulales bacterium]|jgi:hypothetical protein|nr:hypothetical protein [Pirellulales bacterium]
MGMLFNVVGGVLGLAAFVCYIMVVVKMFQNGQTGLGITTIVTLFCCGIGYIIALVVGWQNADKWGIRNVMMIFSICFAASILCNALAYSMGATLFVLPQQ